MLKPQKALFSPRKVRHYGTPIPTVLSTKYALRRLFHLFASRVGTGKVVKNSPEVRAVLRHLLDLPRWDENEIVAWCNWRMERNRIAKLCHEQRRREELWRRSRKGGKAL